MELGVYSLLLLVAALNGVVLGVLLLLPIGRHVGSRWLCALIGAIALRLAPYILGFAGAYDRYQWLTFAPFDLTLFWGPLLWAYMTTLTSGSPPPRIRWHLAPGAVQLVYQLVCFALPLDRKQEWYTGVHMDVIEPVGVVLVLASLGAYGLAALRTYESWQRWLDDNESNREESRHWWLRVIFGGIALTAVVASVLFVVHVAVAPVDYFARIPVVVILGVLVYLMGFLGIRYGRNAIQRHAPPVACDDDSDPRIGMLAAPDEFTSAADTATKDYGIQADAWRQRVIEEGWHRDSQLTLDTLARALCTSSRTLSRALNDGLGVSFNTFVNELRVADARRMLSERNAPTALEVAFAVGFSSKASFNRAFKRHAGETPSEHRAGAVTALSGASRVAPTGDDQVPP